MDKGGGRFLFPPGKLTNEYEKRTETKNVETWRGERELKYTSWQDNTQDINDIRYCPIIEASFSHIFYFDKISENCLAKLRKELKDEAYKHDNDVRSYDEFTVPDFNYKHICPLNEEEYRRIKDKYNNRKGYITWTILFLLGYSSLFETYARYEIAKERITIVKSISKRNDKRASYFTNDTDLPEIAISFVHTKLQTRALERKKAKGEIKNADMDIPLIIVK